VDAQLAVGEHVGYEPLGNFLVRADVEFLPAGAADAGIMFPPVEVTFLMASASLLHALIELAFLSAQKRHSRITLGIILQRRQSREARNFDIATIVALFRQPVYWFHRQTGHFATQAWPKASLRSA